MKEYQKFLQSLLDKPDSYRIVLKHRSTGKAIKKIEAMNKNIICTVCENDRELCSCFESKKDRGWIKCKERMPECAGRYLVYFRVIPKGIHYNTETVCYFRASRIREDGFYRYNERVFPLCWMPLPNEPSEDL